MSKVFEVVLTDPIKVAVNGNEEECYELSFTAPTYKCRDNSIKLRSILQEGMMGSVEIMQKLEGVLGDKDKDEPEPEQDDTGADNAGDDEPMPRQAVSMMLGGRLTQALSLFDKIAVHVGTIKTNDGDINLKSAHFERMSEDDYVNVALGYIGFFTARSMMSLMSDS